MVFFIFPKNGIHIGYVNLHFFDKTAYIDLNANEEPIELKKEINLDSIIAREKFVADSIKKAEELIKKKYEDSVLNAEKKIQFPKNDTTILYPFFKKLEKAKHKKVRVMHYGDSQIEADRISGRLRERLQKDFGGLGAGVYAVIPATRKISIKNEYSANWIRRTGFGPYIDTVVKHKKYGALFSFCEIEPIIIDSSIIYEAWIKIGKPTKSYKHCRNYTNFDIFFTNQDTTTFTYLLADSIIRVDTISPSLQIQKKSLSFNRAPSYFEIHIKSTSSPLIYGIALEGKNGVVVDNIPLRGASGTEFARIDKTSLSEMLTQLSPDLFLLEFGGNAIPHMKSSERSVRYGNYFKSQIKKLKRINPKAQFIVIGPADMAKKESTSFISYPFINEVREALKKAAFETNSCYWDTYLNMGGEGSIQDWVKMKPPLAARDYIHFTNKGAREVADMFIADLMECYTVYKENK